MQTPNIQIGSNVQVWYWIRRAYQGILEDDYTDIQGELLTQNNSVIIVQSGLRQITIQNNRIEYIQTI